MLSLLIVEVRKWGVMICGNDSPKGTSPVLFAQSIVYKKQQQRRLYPDEKEARSLLGMGKVSKLNRCRRRGKKGRRYRHRAKLHLNGNCHIWVARSKLRTFLRVPKERDIYFLRGGILVFLFTRRYVKLLRDLIKHPTWHFYNIKGGPCGLDGIFIRWECTALRKLKHALLYEFTRNSHRIIHAEA